MTADQHGNYSTYCNWHCRCADCTQANTDHNRKRRAERYASGTPATVVHGKKTTYSNWGCRCADCTAANAAVTAEQRRRRAKRAS